MQHFTEFLNFGMKFLEVNQFTACAYNAYIAVAFLCDVSHVPIRFNKFIE